MIVFPSPPVDLPAEVRLDNRDPALLAQESFFQTQSIQSMKPSDVHPLQFLLNVPMDTAVRAEEEWSDQRSRLLPEISPLERYTEEFVHTYRGKSAELHEMIVYFATASHLTTAPNPRNLGSESIALHLTSHLASAAYPSSTQSLLSAWSYSENLLDIIQEHSTSSKRNSDLNSLRERLARIRTTEELPNREFLSDLMEVFPTHNEKALKQLFDLTRRTLNADFSLVGYFLMGPEESYRLPPLQNGPQVLITSPDALINQDTSQPDFLGKYLNELIFYQKLHAARSLGYTPVVIEGNRLSVVQSAQTAQQSQAAELFTRDPFLVVYDAHSQSEIIVLPIATQIDGIDWGESDSFSSLRNYAREQDRLRELFQYLGYRVVEMEINVEGGDFYPLRTPQGRYHVFSFDGAEESNLREAAQKIEELTGIPSIVLERTGPTSDHHFDIDLGRLTLRDGTHLVIVDTAAFTAEALGKLRELLGPKRVIPYESSYTPQLHDEAGGGSLNFMQGVGNAYRNVLISHPDEKFEQLLRHHGFEPVIAKGILPQGLFLGNAGPHCLMQELPAHFASLTTNLKFQDGSLVTMNANSLEHPEQFSTPPGRLERWWSWLRDRLFQGLF